MSKKHLKARCLSSVVLTEKPLSVVGPLKIKSLSNGLKDVQEKVKGPVEGSAWEYKPRRNINSQGTQSGFRSIFNGPNRLQQQRKQPPCISPTSDPQPLLSNNISQQVILIDPKQPSTSSLIMTLAASSSLPLIPALPKEPLPSQKSNNGSDDTTQSPDSADAKTESSQVPQPKKECAKRKREDNLLPKNCKFSRFEIVSTPKDTFGKLLEKLPTDERMIFKDTRRKGKNREAARRARDRQIRQYKQSIKQRDIAEKKLSSDKQALKRLQDKCNTFGAMVDILNNDIKVLESKLK